MYITHLHQHGQNQQTQTYLPAANHDRRKKATTTEQKKYFISLPHAQQHREWRIYEAF